MKAKWISINDKEIKSYSLIKKIVLKSEIKKASLKVSALGWYHIYINDLYPEQDVFKPGWTELQKRVQYQIYDVTKYLKKNNVLKIMVGEGWMAPEFVAPIEGYIKYPASLIYELKLDYKNGEKELIVSSDSDSLYSNFVTYSNIYNGETQDKVNFKQKKLKTIVVKTNTKLIPQEGERILYQERIKPVKMWVNDINETLIDFGQNYTGIVELNIKGKKGDVITLKPAEVLDNKGHFYDENYRSAKSTFSYVLTGNEEKYHPLFSFMGGRYIKIFNAPKYLKKENFEAVLIHSELRKTNTFECGNSKINRLYKNVIYGQLSNYLDVPTDCPQRNERLGWTADTQVFTKTACINYDVKKFLNKWLYDVRLTQRKDGAIYSVVPTHNYGMRLGIGWGDAIAVVPYQLYMAYNDKKIITDNIEAIKKWISFLLNSAKEKYVPYFEHIWADWCALDRDLTIEPKNHIGGTSEKLLNVAYLAIDLSILIYFLKELKKPYQKYQLILNKVKTIYQKKFIKNGHMIGKKGLIFSLLPNETCYTQTGLVYSLYFNLCKTKDRKSLLKDLVNLIHECGDCLATGFLGTPYLLETLSSNGYSELAYTLLFQEKNPSWLYSVNKGATTMWEHYDGIKEDGTFCLPSMNSYNHYAYGAVYAWIFNNCVGIKIKKPGYKEIEISPIYDKRLGFVNSTMKTSYGDIKVYWDKNQYKISVPKGIKAYINIKNLCNKVISGKEIIIKNKK